MNDKLKEYMANVPYVGEDAYNELSQIIDEKVKSSRLTYPEKDRECQEKCVSFWVRLNFHTSALGFGTWN